MANRAQFRTGLRDLINDPAGAPLWTDSALNAAIADAVARYGVWNPVGAAESLSVVAGTTAYALPAAVAPDSALEIFDAGMNRIPPAQHAPLEPGPSDAWNLALEWWQAAGSIYLTRTPSNTETWTIFYLAGRSCPVNDVDPVPVLEGHEPIVYQLAAAQLIERRALDDAKHGPATASSRAQMRALARHYREQAESLMNLYRRRARGGSVAS